MATEKRLVYAEEVEELIAGMDSLPWEEDVETLVNSLTTADAVEVIHGHWVVTEDIPTIEKTVACSVCHCSTYYPKTRWHDIYLSNYCPQCGAKMDGDGNGA